VLNNKSDVLGPWAQTGPTSGKKASVWAYGTKPSSDHCNSPNPRNSCHEDRDLKPKFST